MQCDYCDRWVHVGCDGVGCTRRFLYLFIEPQFDDQAYEALSALEDFSYACPDCRKNKNSADIVKAVARADSQRLHELLGRINEAVCRYQRVRVDGRLA